MNNKRNGKALLTCLFLFYSMGVVAAPERYSFTRQFSNNVVLSGYFDATDTTTLDGFNSPGADGAIFGMYSPEFANTTEMGDLDRIHATFSGNADFEALGTMDSVTAPDFKSLIFYNQDLFSLVLEKTSRLIQESGAFFDKSGSVGIYSGEFRYKLQPTTVPTPEGNEEAYRLTKIWENYLCNPSGTGALQACNLGDAKEGTSGKLDLVIARLGEGDTTVTLGPIPAVPVPSALYLFASGLLPLFYGKARKALA